MNRTEIFWDKQSIRFEKLTNKDEESFIKIIEKTKKYLSNTDKVLDFACGIGTSSLNMVDYVEEIQAIDISSGMINVAHKRMNEHNTKNIKFIHASIFDEQFKNESFDVITAFNIMHLLEDPKIEIHRINDLLKPGGLFISSSAFLGEKSLFRFIFFLISKVGIVPHLKLLKTNEFEKLVISENFKIIETQKSSHPTPNGFIVVKKL
ncbi:class I SAM-dependent methyltransferase [Bacteroidota bacterium]